MHCGYSPTNCKPKAVLLSVHSESLLVPVFADKETQESPLSGCLWLSKHRHRPSPSPLRCDCLLFFFSPLISPLLSVFPCLQSVLSVVILWPESLCFYTCTALLFPLFASCVASLYLSRVWASIVLGGGRGLGSPSGVDYGLLHCCCSGSVFSGPLPLFCPLQSFFPFPYCMSLNERWIKQKKKKKNIVCFLYFLFTLTVFTLFVCLIM